MCSKCFIYIGHHTQNVSGRKVLHKLFPEYRCSAVIVVIGNYQRKEEQHLADDSKTSIGTNKLLSRILLYSWANG